MENLEMIKKSKKIIAMNRKVRAPKGEVFESNLEEFVNVTKTDEVASLINQIRQTEDKDERRRLKGQLPSRRQYRRRSGTCIPQARCCLAHDGCRGNGNSVDSGRAAGPSTDDARPCPPSVESG